ncbi:MAG: aldehyde dehydrogenase family protein [Francisellaceae bacterium]|jgi:betaine-aldehyde dehydrogenase|nr:aldehyde dehydrogenase family protein [Francisellaceae bacterium]MBT6539631.1 aldehyde dehydrogenase family protein [Francisellaceae bacterium]
MSGAEALRSQNMNLAEMEVLDTGKPISESVYDDAIGAAKCIEFFAGLIDKLYGQSIKVDDALIYTQKEPIGVCFGIGAWNYPLLVASWKLAPELATGNSLTYKPSEHSSTSTLKLAQILTNAGLPKGVFNVVLGDGEVGQYLSVHEKVRKVSLTGTVSTGKQVVQNTASTLENISMELGGKSPLIVFDDADISQAVDAAMVGNFYTQGQVCSNCSRVYLHSKIYDEFIVKLKEKTEKLVIGNPFSTKTQVGSLISQEHMDKVLSYIQSGISEGA